MSLSLKMEKGETMCGRYYIDSRVIRYVLKLVKNLDIVSDKEESTVFGFQREKVRDIHPSEKGIVLWEENSLKIGQMRWGFPGESKTGLLINARVESVLERPLFRKSFLQRRCVLPAAGFYEWNQKREKNTFWNREKTVLYLAGIYDLKENERRFVILTTQANESMKDVHDRMPLILEEEEVDTWIRDASEAEKMLQKVPPSLERFQEYEQMSLFDM